MRQRWIILPVLMPLQQDYPEIIVSIVQSINKNFILEPENEILKASAQRFVLAGAAPREIREALIASQAVIVKELSIEHIEFASYDIIPNNNISASVFSDYVALSYCRNNSFLPWWDDQKNSPDQSYPYPAYIREILTNDYLIDQQKLNQIIKQMEPYVNL
jgi:hypothetical protein